MYSSGQIGQQGLLTNNPGRGDDSSQRVSSCSPCPPLTSVTGYASGCTAKRAVRGAWRSAVHGSALGSASHFGKWRNKGNKGKPLCEQQRQPLSMGNVVENIMKYEGI